MKFKPRASLAAYLALAYTLVIAYASVQPFTGWRMPPPEVFAFLGAPWPRYITAGDIALNVAAYLPLGAMLFAMLRPPLAPAIALVVATLLGALLSLALESVQMFLPTRIASNVDLLANSFGAALGALGATVLNLSNNPLASIRAQRVRPGLVGDCGLVVLLLWLVIQFHPSPVAMGSGNVRDVFGLTPGFTHSSQAYLLGEAAVAAGTIAALGLLISLLFLSRRDALRAMLAMLVLTAVAKSAAALAIARSGNWFQWLTPGVAAGIAAGALGIAVLVWLPPRLRAVAGSLCLAAAVVIINLMPDNPYQTPPAYLSTVPPTHLANFGGIVRLLSQGWPFLAIVLLAALMRARPVRRLL